MKNLRKPLTEFSFVKREERQDKVVANKCGRDFLYYALNFYFPDRFNRRVNFPEQIDRKEFFGKPTSPLYAWTQLQFLKVPRQLKKLGLKLIINDREITNYFVMFRTILLSRKTYVDAIRDVETCIDQDQAVGIDISLGLLGLRDHVLFVYGYDTEHLYVFDTHVVPRLEYERMGDEYYFKLPKSIVKKRWTRFGRVWKVIRD